MSNRRNWVVQVHDPDVDETGELWGPFKQDVAERRAERLRGVVREGVIVSAWPVRRWTSATVGEVVEEFGPWEHTP